MISEQCKNCPHKNISNEIKSFFSHKTNNKLFGKCLQEETMPKNFRCFEKAFYVDWNSVETQFQEMIERRSSGIQNF
ncbi:MAG: hypothetical protein LBF97_03460 [Elusimicrobiota bacterium]|jgi:hypothetical protein|nr:hypothetical protein [Elusimicrobiota bacterium]